MAEEKKTVELKEEEILDRQKLRNIQKNES